METLIPGFIGLTLFGLITAYLGRLIWLARSSRSWPSVEGTITGSRVREWQAAKGGQGVNRRMSYAPDVQYKYTTLNEQHVGRIVCFGRNWNTNHQDARNTIADYPVGTVVQVHHHPTDPRLATLETRASSRVYLFVTISAGMSAAILCGMFAAI